MKLSLNGMSAADKLCLIPLAGNVPVGAATVVSNIVKAVADLAKLTFLAISLKVNARKIAPEGRTQIQLINDSHRFDGLVSQSKGIQAKQAEARAQLAQHAEYVAIGLKRLVAGPVRSVLMMKEVAAAQAAAEQAAEDAIKRMKAPGKACAQQAADQALAKISLARWRAILTAPIRIVAKSAANISKTKAQEFALAALTTDKQVAERHAAAEAKAQAAAKAAARAALVKQVKDGANRVGTAVARAANRAWSVVSGNPVDAAAVALVGAAFYHDLAQLQINGVTVRVRQ